MLKEAGMQKINFSGGEPFLHQRGKFVGELAKYCKKELAVPSVSIISNGSLITEKWMKEFGECIDILGVSCDSFNEEVNCSFMDLEEVSYEIYVLLVSLLIKILKSIEPRTSLSRLSNKS